MLDLLAGIGGLFNVFSALCSAAVKLVHYRAVYQFMMADLFLDRATHSMNLSQKNSNKLQRTLTTVEGVKNDI